VIDEIIQFRQRGPYKKSKKEEQRGTDTTMY